MGIGIYSSFHLCDELNIYSKPLGGTPNLLTFHFKQMRETLEKQRELRYLDNITDDQLIALQDLLANNISLKDLSDEDYPRNGTRVEMIGIEQSFFKSLSRFGEISDYLEQQSLIKRGDGGAGHCA